MVFYSSENNSERAKGLERKIKKNSSAREILNLGLGMLEIVSSIGLLYLCFSSQEKIKYPIVLGLSMATLYYDGSQRIKKSINQIKCNKYNK